MVVGGDEHAGEPAVGGYAADGHLLRAHRLLHRGECGFRIGSHRALAAEHGLQPGDPFGRGIDRAGHTPGAGGVDRPQADDEILEVQRRPAGGGADDRPGGVHGERIGRPGKDDVVAIGIDEHMLDPLQAAEELNLGR